MVNSAKFPHVNLSGFRLLGEGGAFSVFETDNGLAWRFLKQPAGEAGLDVEIRLLPELADAVSLSIPLFEYISDRTLSPRFVGYRKIEGVPFARERLSACRSDAPLEQLAQFLSELRAFPVEQAQALGVPMFAPQDRHAEYRQWSEQIHQHVFPLLDERQHTRASQVISDLLDDPAMLDFVPALCHSDLWDEHLLFDPKREELTGVIDWESASISDSVGDWVALWLDHGEETINRLLALYQGTINATFRHRMMRLANFVPLHEILCGVLYDDRASWQDGWQRFGLMIRS